jgi:hypothetical protein
MKKCINKIALMLLMAFAAACVDESLDPVKFNEVKKATILALRGDSFNNLNNTGCVSSFFKNNLVNGETFSVDADYLAEDQESLQEVQLYTSILNTTSKGLAARPRTLVTTVPGSAFTFPADSKTKRGNISATRAAIIAALNIPADSLIKLGTNDITMDMDLVLTDGSKVLASSIVNPNLFQSVIFYPAMVLAYCANDADDFAPQATTKMLGEYSKSSAGVVTRTVVPLKSGVSDTLHIAYDQAEIITPPSVAFSPASGGTFGAVTKYKTTKNQFYVIYTAGATYTGAVTATVTGATANVSGVVLTQDSKTQTINVDNTAPVRISTDTGDRIGVGQFVTIVVNFNEMLSTKSANAIKVTIDGTALGLEDVTDAPMTIASNGLSASLIYIFKLAVPTVPATHGSLVVDFTTDAKDVAGNATVIPDGALTVDVNAPPTPVATLVSPTTYDLGTQLRWNWTQGVSGTNTGGATTGVVHFIAIDEALSSETTIPGPTSVSFDADLVPTWVMPENPNSTASPKAKVAIRQSGAVVITKGNSGTSGTLTTIFTPFTANRAVVDDMGTPGDLTDDVTRGFNIYAVFRGSTGNVSAITLVPQATVIMK